MNTDYSFKIIKNNSYIKGCYYYNSDFELDFETDYEMNLPAFSLMIGKGYNHLDFSIATKKLEWFGGYNHIDFWINSNLTFPISEKGEIYIENEFENIMDGQWYVKNWNTYYDKEKNVICMGNNSIAEKDIIIEFAKDSVAVFEKNILKAVWIKNVKFL